MSYCIARYQIAKQNVSAVMFVCQRHFFATRQTVAIFPSNSIFRDEIILTREDAGGTARADLWELLSSTPLHLDLTKCISISTGKLAQNCRARPYRGLLNTKTRHLCRTGHGIVRHGEPFTLWIKEAALTFIDLRRLYCEGLAGVHIFKLQIL